MAAHKRSFNHPRRSSSPFSWRHVVAVLLVIAGVFFLFERLKKGHQQETAVIPQPLAPVKQPLPAHSDYELGNFTSVRKSAPQGKSASLYPVIGKGSMAIIVDDMGSSLQEAQKLLAMNIPLTFSIIPGLPKAKAVAEAARNAGTKVMVHLPMEPKGYPQQRLEQNGLLVRYSTEEITARTEALLAAVPDAVGANNHMGSRFTELEEKMSPVLNVLKAKGLYFVDSRTTSRSVGFALAEKQGVKTATRNVFLDNEQDVAAIRKQIFAAAEMARIKGSVIAICHPHPTSIQALQEALPELKSRGVRFVTAGELVK